MRITTFLLAACLATPALAAPGALPPPLLLTDAFTASWETTKDQPPAARVADFRSRVAARFPAFYRNKGDGADADSEQRILRALDNFPAIRAGYERKAAEFTAMLDTHLATFRARFPDYRPNHEIVVLHSLGEMDGGVRTLDGKPYLIFGVDVMARREGSEAAFFHHELFHTYHLPYLGRCEGGIWMPLWAEGLATHVAKTMNPQASDTELLLDVPAGTVARTKASLDSALEQLARNLDSEDATLAASLFTTRGADGALPVRRGYYLGYLVAQQAGRHHGLEQLAQLDCAQVRALIGTALDELRQARRP